MAAQLGLATGLIAIAAALSTAGQWFHPGAAWSDIGGNRIRAHGGGVLEQNGTFYWYGPDYTLGKLNKVGVVCYSSRDLYNWKREAVVLAAAEMPRPFGEDGVCERPKVLHNRSTGEYVMWMHLDDPRYRTSLAGVATAQRPTGPFRFVWSGRPIRYDFGAAEDDANGQEQRGGTFRDMALFQDDDGTAYVFYASEGNKTMYVARLNAEYTNVETPAVLGKTWARILIGQSREAPAPFKHNGQYYLITSGCTGWRPNPASYATAARILGPWVERGNPAVGDEAGSTFRSQSTFVLPLRKAKPGSFIFMADRWNEKHLEDSRHIWLPFRAEPDGSFRLVWKERWNLSHVD